MQWWWCSGCRCLVLLCPRGDGPHKAVVKCRGNPAGTLQATLNPAISKTGVKMTLDECQSVFTLIRTDTTHDLSQKAEKVCQDVTSGWVHICPRFRQPEIWTARNNVSMKPFFLDVKCITPTAVGRRTDHDLDHRHNVCQISHATVPVFTSQRI